VFLAQEWSNLARHDVCRWCKTPPFVSFLVGPQPQYMVKTVSSYLECQTFQTSFQSATSTCRGMRVGGLVSLVLFSLYVYDIHKPSRHVELAQYAEDTSLVATSCRVYRFSSVIWRPISVEWNSGNGIGGLPSTCRGAQLYSFKATRHFLREPMQWVVTACNLGMTLDTGYLVCTRQPGEEEGRSKVRRAFLSP
jgi:hypothetical protein